MYLMHAIIDCGIAFSCFSLDGVSVLCVGLGALRPDFTMLGFGIAFASFSLDGVSVLLPKKIAELRRNVQKSRRNS